MRTLRLALLARIAIVIAAFATIVAAEPAGGFNPRPSSHQAPVPAERLRFAGVWQYNEVLSLDAATGQPERPPTRERSPGAVRPGSSSPSGMTPDRPGTGGSILVGPGGVGTSCTNCGGGSTGQGAAITLTQEAARRAANAPNGATPITIPNVDEGYALKRDLLEISERLTLTVTPESVTVLDDLDRTRTYRTNGKGQRQQLGSSSFETKTRWEGAQLMKEIKGAMGFKMTEVWAVSEDGSQLLAVIRIAQTRKDAKPMGVDRVYDRVK